MRYIQIDTVSFTAASGITVALKGMREIPTQTIGLRIRVTENDRVDEIASRPEVYGSGGYRNSYKLLDANAVRLVEGLLDMGKIGIFEVPA